MLNLNMNIWPQMLLVIPWLEFHSRLDKLHTCIWQFSIMLMLSPGVLVWGVWFSFPHLECVFITRHFGLLSPSSQCSLKISQTCVCMRIPGGIVAIFGGLWRERDVWVAYLRDMYPKVMWPSGGFVYVVATTRMKSGLCNNRTCIGQLKKWRNQRMQHFRMF